MIFPIFLILLLINIGSAQAESFRRVDLPELAGKAVLAADLQGTGFQQLIVGGESEVLIYSEETPVVRIDGFLGTVTSLAVGDLTGDFRPELVVGTNNAGAIHVFQRKGTNWERQQGAGYLWDAPNLIQVVDINGDGWGDLIARTDKGAAFVYLSWDGELFNIWRSETNTAVLFFAGQDLDGDARPELILAESPDRIQVLKWQGDDLEIIWENYPWGRLVGVGLLKPTGRNHMITAITNQDMLYAWEWRPEGFALIHHFFDTRLRGQFGFFDQHIIAFSSEHGLMCFSLTSSGLEEEWSFPYLSNGKMAGVHRDRLLFQDSSGKYFYLEQVADDYWELLLDGELVSEEINFTWPDEAFLVSLAEFEQPLGFSMLAYQERILLVNQGELLVLFPEQPKLIWRGMVIPLSHPVLLKDSQLFVPLDFLEFLGLSGKLDPARRHLKVERLSGK